MVGYKIGFKGKTDKTWTSGYEHRHKWRYERSLPDFCHEKLKYYLLGWEKWGNTDRDRKGNANQKLLFWTFKPSFELYPNGVQQIAPQTAVQSEKRSLIIIHIFLIYHKENRKKLSGTIKDKCQGHFQLSGWVPSMLHKVWDIIWKACTENCSFN